MRITQNPVRPLRMVAVGDSLTAGFQDATLKHDRQEHSYPAQLARAAGIDFKQPLIGGNGIPPGVFQGEGISLPKTLWRYLQVGLAMGLPAATIALGFVPYEWALWPLYRAGGMGTPLPGHETGFHNLSVPNFELRHVSDVSNVADLMTDMAERRSQAGGLMMLGPYVRTILQESEATENGKSQIDRAVAHNPDLIVFWAGNNDALESVNGGVVDDRTLTPIDDQIWTYKTVSPITGRASEKQTEQVNPGFRTSLQRSLSRLLGETQAEIAILSIPDVSVIPYLRTAGEPMGPLPYRVVLPNGTDVTARLEKWVIPNGNKDGGVFPPGTRVGMKTVLTKFLSSGEIFNEEQLEEQLNLLGSNAIFTEDEVLTPDEVQKIQKRTAEYNQIIQEWAIQNPRLHLVDSGGLLMRAKDQGLPLRGSGDEVTVTTTYTGIQDPRGFAGFFSYDGMHPSDVGHSVIANAVLDKLKADLAANPKFLALTSAPEIDERQTLRQDPRMKTPTKLVLSRFHLDSLAAPRWWGFR